MTALALPDTNSLALDGVLSAEGTDVAGVLLDFHLLHLLTQGGTVSVIDRVNELFNFSVVIRFSTTRYSSFDSFQFEQKSVFRRLSKPN